MRLRRDVRQTAGSFDSPPLRSGSFRMTKQIEGMRLRRDVKQTAGSFGFAQDRLFDSGLPTLASKDRSPGAPIRPPLRMTEWCGSQFA